MKKQNWVWMPHPGHLIVSRDCRFHLNTYVGGYVVSTVGEYFPDSSVREIFAKSRGIVLEGQGDARDADYMKKIGYEDIGSGRKYETLVFKAKKGFEECCPFNPKSWLEVDGDGYNSASDAYKGHLKLCAEWAKKK